MNLKLFDLNWNHMNFFIDLEFCIASDTIISLGIVSEDDKHRFYEVLDHSTVTDEWVKDNVIPILQKDPITLTEFHERLTAFCGKFAGMHLIANHPNDIRFFNELLINGDKGKWILIQPLTFEVDDNLSGKQSTLLHNALHDAIATREDWFRHNGYK